MDNTELLMHLSADTLLAMVRHPNINPADAALPDVAFTHALKLLTLNTTFKRRLEQAQLEGPPTSH